MKSALSLTLIVCLVGSTLPAAAEDRLDESTSDSIARAVTREAVRLATERIEPADRDWSRVGTAEPGEVVQTIAQTDITFAAVAHKRKSTAAKVLMGVGIGVVVFLMVLRRVLPKS